MSSREDQVQSEVMDNGAEEEAASRILALDPGEGEAWWWMSGLATVKATAERPVGHLSGKPSGRAREHTSIHRSA